jgi:hypothetical protein
MPRGNTNGGVFLHYAAGSAVDAAAAMQGRPTHLHPDRHTLRSEGVRRTPSGRRRPLHHLGRHIAMHVIKKLTLLLAWGAALPALAGSDKLLLTGGVTQLEGAAGGGLTPWAVIAGYGTRDQIGANAFYTGVWSQDYGLATGGIAVGLWDRLELSYARQRFNTREVGGALGLGNGFAFNQDVFGVKLRVLGNAVLDQDSWLPQIAIGVQHKRNDQGAVLRAIGAKDDHGTDFYVSATKLFLAQSVLANATLRQTKANQLGILGFGGDKRDGYSTQFETSLAYLVRKDLAVGVEYRSKPDNLKIAREDDWYDFFVAYQPIKNVSVTLAYAHLGNIVIKDNQRAPYLSLQVGF